MESLSNTERLAIRFAPYIRELRDFYKSRALRFGSPEDMAPLAEGLSSQGSLHEEMTSMIRSIVFRERGVMPRNELLELILVSIGGAEIDQAAQEIVASVGVLYEFVSEVIHSLKKKSFVEDEDDEDAASTGASFAEHPLVSEQGNERMFADVGAGLNSIDEAKWGLDADQDDPVEGHPLPRVFERVQTVLSPSEESGAGRVARVLPPKPRVLDATELALSSTARVPIAPHHFFRNALCVLFLMLAGTLLWRHWHPVRNSGISGASQAVAAVEPGLAPSGSLVGRGVDAQDRGRSPESGTEGGGPSSVLSRQLSEARIEKRLTLDADDHRRSASPSTAGFREVTPPPNPVTGFNSKAEDSVGTPSAGRGRSHRLTRPKAPQAVASVPPTAVGKQGGFLVSSGMMDGNLIAAPAPKYPKWASMAGVEGQVILQAVVSRNGTVVAAHVLEGHHLLRGAAVHAVKSWRYRPYVVGGKPTDVATVVIVEFHLPH